MDLRRPTEPDDRFASGALQAATPLLIWAAHFFVSYMTIKAACALDLQRFALAGITGITIFLGVVSAAAIAALVWMLVLEGREAKRHFERGSGTLEIVHTGATIFALTAVLWSTVVIVLVHPCATVHEGARAAATALFSALPSTLEICVVR